MAKHTPGPWRIHRKPVTVSIRDARGYYITENVRGLPNQDANARLIAAAPDAVELLQRIVSYIESPYDALRMDAVALLRKIEDGQ